METKANLFGQALIDHYNGRPKGPFYVCTETEEHAIDLAFYLSAEPTSLETQALGHVRGSVLDVGCGAGRMIRYLRDLGYHVIGFDIDPLAVRLCHELGATNVVVESYYSMDRFAPVDTVLWLNRTLCTGGTLSQIESLLASSRRVCTLDGVIILESYEVTPAKSKCGEGVGETTLHYRYGDEVGEPFTRTCFSADVAVSMLERTGWVDVEILREGDLYIAVARNGGG